MIIEETYIDELIYIRDNERQAHNWTLCDAIRDYLDSKCVFIFDTKDGQEIYHELSGMTRSKLIEKINKNHRAEKVFDAWLYTVRSKSVTEVANKNK